jgi:Fe-Mn family superoxide dismutase
MNITRRDAVKTIALAAAGAAMTGRRAEAQAPAAGPFTLPDLPYAFDALEPHIDAQTMQIHHGKHHAAYIAKLNEAVAKHPALAARPVENLVRDLASIPEDIRTAVRSHGGGHANHALFWTCLKPGGGGEPAGKLAETLTSTFGSFAGFRDQFKKAALGVFGSGWAWLSLDAGRKLLIESTPNQDTPLSAGREPLLGLDVWEHAYYLRYQNRRADYADAFFNVVDWSFVARRYDELRG